MTIRPAKANEVDKLLEIYETAKSFMRKNGNMTQWAGAYPGRELLLKDIEAGALFVRVDETDEPNGVFYMKQEIDPTYINIYEGQWQNAAPYAVIHRIASDGEHKGLLSDAVKFALNISDNIRMDTHRDNLPMQSALSKQGFRYSGIIYLENGDERLAYHLCP